MCPAENVQMDGSRSTEIICETTEPTGAPLAKDELERICTDVACRLHDAFDFRSVRDIAIILRASCRSVEAFINGREFPSTDLLLQAHAATGVSLHWILTGEGSRFPAAQTAPAQQHYAPEWVELGLA